MEYIIVFIFGAIIGSFLNVCIYRLPLGLSIVKPRSFCPFCEHPIKWFENVPFLSYLVLRGRCRYCHLPISFRYFLVELTTALSGVGLFFYRVHYGLPLEWFFVYAFFTAILIAIIFIDIEHQEIPDIISIPGIVVGILLTTIFRTDGSTAYMGSFLNSAFGVLAGGGSMFLLGVFGELVFKKEALGGGDVKLMGMIGAFLGWKLVLLTFFLAPVLGSGVGIFMKIKFKKEVIPYGPYLALGALASLLYGNKILEYIFGY
ncbi:MAG: prepilin peptidase [Candidatus Omnitrophica bacterium]|nr:prepilin peptidase [Candidatus Omnitrophota bacterium]